MAEISIITPVYNVDKYLSKCLDSILCQTFKNYELIIVDDGSTDLSGRIADSYAKEDSRIKVIHKENGGAASARNEGLKIASGNYVYFPDPDDWLEKDYLNSLYQMAIKSDAELVISGFHMDYIFDEKNISFVESVHSNIFDSKTKVRENIHNYFDNMMVAVPWNKLYKKEYLDQYNLRFPNLKWDDLHFNLEVLKNINSVAILDSCGYHFLRNRAGSETTVVFDKYLFSKRKEQFKHIMDVYLYWNITNKKILGVLYDYYLGRIFQCIQEIAGNSQSIEDKKRCIFDILNDDLTVAALNGYCGTGILKKITFRLLKCRNVFFILFLGRIVNKIKSKHEVSFIKIKNKLINKANEVGK